jgi:hypothetical protein
VWDGDDGISGVWECVFGNGVNGAGGCGLEGLWDGRMFCDRIGSVVFNAGCLAGSCSRLLTGAMTCGV